MKPSNFLLQSLVVLSSVLAPLVIACSDSKSESQTSSKEQENPYRYAEPNNWSHLQATADQCCSLATDRDFLQCVVNRGNYLQVFTDGTHTANPRYFSVPEGRQYLCNVVRRKNIVVE